MNLARKPLERLVVDFAKRGLVPDPDLARSVLSAAAGDDLDPDQEAEALWYLVGICRAIERAAGFVRAALEEELRANVARHGAVRFGDVGFYAGKKTETKLLEGQGPALVEWLGDDLKHAVNPNSLRTSAIVAIATKRGLDPDAIFGSFFQRKELVDDNDDRIDVLNQIPSTKAKWVQALSHGERRPKK